MGKFKRNINNISGISVQLLLNKFNGNNTLIKQYLDGWICFSLLLRDFVRKKLS